MDYFKSHKEVSLLVVTVFILIIVAFNWFQNQKKRSRLIESGTIILPAAAQCEVPIPDLYKRRVQDKVDLSSGELKKKTNRLNMNKPLFKTQSN